MATEPIALVRFGALGQLGLIALAVSCWLLDVGAGFLAACVGYFVVTMVGILGMSRAEGGIVGAVMYPFVLPGLLPLYYVATR